MVFLFKMFVFIGLPALIGFQIWAIIRRTKEKNKPLSAKEELMLLTDRQHVMEALDLMELLDIGPKDLKGKSDEEILEFVKEKLKEVQGLEDKFFV